MTDKIETYEEDIEDIRLRDSIQNIKETYNDMAFIKGKFKFFEITFSAAATNDKYPHNLGFTPKDVIHLSATDGATVTWNYDSFDGTNLDITTSAATTIRAFIGRYEEGEA